MPVTLKHILAIICNNKAIIKAYLRNIVLFPGNTYFIINLNIKLGHDNSICASEFPYLVKMHFNFFIFFPTL